MIVAAFVTYGEGPFARVLPTVAVVGRNGIDSAIVPWIVFARAYPPRPT